METVVGEPADVVGHSDGAFVAMLVAMQRPELVKRLVMISGGFSNEGEAAPDAGWDVDQIFEFLGPSYGEVSPDGIDHFKVVATKVGEMAAKEPYLQASKLAVVPGTSHFLTQEKPALVNAIVLDFLTNEPVPTVAPIRRAPRP